MGHQNREAMANVGVRVERFVRLGREGRVWQVHSRCVRLDCPQKSGKILRLIIGAMAVDLCILFHLLFEN